MVVVGVGLAPGAGVPRTEVTLGVELGQVGLLWRLSLTEPWALCTVGRNEDVLAGERINWDGVGISCEAEGECQSVIPRRWG